MSEGKTKSVMGIDRKNMKAIEGPEYQTGGLWSERRHGVADQRPKRVQVQIQALA